MAGVLDFFSHEAGQARTRALNEAVGGLLNEYLGPTGIPERLGLLASMTPAAGVSEAIAGTRDALNPELAFRDRMMGLGRAGLGVGTTVAPAAAARLMPSVPGASLADDFARNTAAVEDSLLGYGQNFAADEFGGIRAWHGSPHDFDKFSLDKIGTGEGAQAYGHGLYFAENDAVAKGYRDQIAGRIDTQRVSIDGQEYVPPTEAHQRAAAIIAKDGRGSAFDVLNAGIREGYMDNETEKAYREVLKLTAKKDVQPMTTGRLYEVEINADPEDFLDWDAPLRAQRPKVAEFFGETPDPDLAAKIEFARKKYDETGAPDDLIAYNRLIHGDDYRGGPAGPRVQAQFKNAETAQRLREAGIPGIKYYDQGSRSAGEGTRNYVVFDDNLISILNKYGLLGAFGLGAMSAPQDEQGLLQ